MMNKIALVLCLLITACGLAGQNILTNSYGDTTAIYVMLPVNQIYFSEETASAEYQISLNLMDSKQKNVYQKNHVLKLSSQTANLNPVPVIAINLRLATGKYLLVTNMQNLRLGDKTERQFNITVPEKSAAKVINTIIAMNDMLTFMPLGFDELNTKLKYCRLFLDTFADSDSILLKAVVNDTLKSYRIMKNSGYSYDLLPLLETGKISWLELDYFKGNVMEQNEWLFFDSTNMYQTAYSLKDQLLQIKYIATQNEWKTIKRLAQNNEDSAIRYFWDKHNNSTDGTRNDFQELFFGRVIKADELFTIHKKMPGWKSDRGRIFIIKGPPDDITEDVFPIGKKPYVIWRYFDDNSAYRFVDKSGYGNYTLEVEESEF